MTADDHESSSLSTIVDSDEACVAIAAALQRIQLEPSHADVVTDDLLSSSLDNMKQWPRASLCRLLAELAKRPACRRRLSDVDGGAIYGRLASWLREELDRDRQDGGCCVHACRALGNLCHDDEPGRRALLPHLDVVSAVLADCRTSTASATAADDDHAQLLRHVTSGVLLNACYTFEPAVDWLVQSGTLAVCVDTALTHSGGSDVPPEPSLIRHVLLLAGNVLEYERWRPAVLIDTRLVQLVYNALSTCVVSTSCDSGRHITDVGERMELLEEVISLLTDWVSAPGGGSGDADGDCRLALATGGVCRLLCRVLDDQRSCQPTGHDNGHDNGCDRRCAGTDDRLTPAQVSRICDVLVEVLSCERAMAALFAKGAGPAYAAIVNWVNVDASAADDGGCVDATLATAGLCCLVNFATSDDNALAMVSAGLDEKIVRLHILPPHDESVNSPDSSETVRRVSYALSLLRNLCVPARGHQILRERVVRQMLELWPRRRLQQAPPLLFKYYAVLRLLTDGAGRTAAALLRCENMLQTVCTHSRTHSPFGVHHEAARLLARVVRTVAATESSGETSRQDPDDNSMDGGGERALCRLAQQCEVYAALATMLNTPPAAGGSVIMHNEALVSLCLLAAHCQCWSVLASSNMTSQLETLVVGVARQSEGKDEPPTSPPSLPAEVSTNVVSLLRVLLAKCQDAPTERRTLSTLLDKMNPAVANGGHSAKVT